MVAIHLEQNSEKIRQIVKQRLASLSAETRSKYSEFIQSHIELYMEELSSQVVAQEALRATLPEKSHLIGKAPLNVGIYAPMPSEPDLMNWALKFQIAGKALFWFPSFFDLGLASESFSWKQGDLRTMGDWKKNSWGFIEPTSAQNFSPSVSDPISGQSSGPISGQPASEKNPALQVIFIPGLAFSTKGARIGRGKGHYDRVLSQYPDAKRIGVCFEEQVFEELPQNSWDISMHRVVTNQGWIF